MKTTTDNFIYDILKGRSIFLQENGRFPDIIIVKNKIGKKWYENCFYYKKSFWDKLLGRKGTRFNELENLFRDREKIVLLPEFSAEGDIEFRKFGSNFVFTKNGNMVDFDESIPEINISLTKETQPDIRMIYKITENGKLEKI